MQPPSVDALVVASDHDGTIPRFEEKKFTALLVICLSDVWTSAMWSLSCSLSTLWVSFLDFFVWIF